MTEAVPRRRVRAEVRRELLLDAAAELLAERGATAITMEGVAARAGVNKALPYRHFANAEDLLQQLYVRFSLVLAAKVLAAIEQHDELEARVRAVVHAYFDVVAEHRALLSVAFAPGSEVTVGAARELDAPTFVADLMANHLGVPRKVAAATGDLVLGILAAGAQTWARRTTSRRRVEALTTGAVLGVLRTTRA